jgi:Holliday junction resolvase
MSKTPEGKVKDQVREVLDSLGAYYFFPPANGYGRAGIPDVVACYKGHFIAIECKVANKEPTELQKRELSRITKCGGTSFVANPTTVTQLKDFITYILGESNENNMPSS